MQSLFQSNMSGFATGALTALIGVIVAIVASIGTPGPLIGGAAVLALPAFLIAVPVAAVGGYAALRYYRRVSEDTKRELNTRIDEIEATYHEALDKLTQKERNRLTQYGTQVLTPIFSRLDVLSERYNAQESQMRGYLERVASLRKEIEAGR